MVIVVKWNQIQTDVNDRNQWNYGLKRMKWAGWKGDVRTENPERKLDARNERRKMKIEQDNKWQLKLDRCTK